MCLERLCFIELDGWLIGWLVGWLVGLFIRSFVHSFFEGTQKLNKLSKIKCTHNRDSQV
jgi:hypothetical protein